MTDKSLNPEIKTVTIGVRELREIEIYPLSVGEQMKLTDLITETLQQFLKEGGEKEVDAEFVKFVVNLIKDNLQKILTLVTDYDGAEIMYDMTNSQFVEVAELVYEMNFGGIKGKLKRFLSKLTPMFKDNLNSIPNPPKAE